MKKTFIPLIIAIGISININAQEKSQKELKGDRFTFNYSYDKAIEKYAHAKELSIEGQRRLAESYHYMGRNTESEEVYSKLIIASEGVIPEDYYNYSMVLKMNGKYEAAGNFMNKFLKLKPEDLRAKSYASNNEDLANMLKEDGRYKINTLNINSESDDFGACYYNNGIVFSSTREKPKMIVRKYNWTGKPFWDMYFSEPDKDGQLSKPKIFNKRLNGKLHDGPASFSKDGNLIAFTRNHYKDKSKDRVVELQIWFSTFKDEKWSSPEPFALNSSDYSVGQPSLSADGKIMYFTSDMPGGYGGADIYKVTMDSRGVWGKPENMGNRINTEGDEMFPFFEENNKVLFFTSNGRFGLGGLDIFVCTLEDYGFGQIFNAGYPLNTQADDFALIVDKNTAKGYFSSDRNGGSGSDDIYSVDLLKGFKRDNNMISDLNDSMNILFTVSAPIKVAAERKVRETFPIRNYVFFDLGSSEIPDRYVLLKKDQIKEFKEEQLEVFIPKNLSGRSNRQMTAYYNVLNILGDRMGKNPSAKVRLTGASMSGEDEGIIMANNIKKYLVNIFEIDTSRITTEGRVKPRIPNEKPGFTHELDLLREGDRRVSIWSESPAILMEFQTGPDAPLKPVEIVSILETPLDSYVTFNVDGGKDTIKVWSMEIMDDKGIIQKFGPYYLERVSIPGSAILGSRTEGNFKVTMTGKINNNVTVMKDTTVHMVLWTSTLSGESLRFSVIYEFNESDVITIYEKYLTDIVIPKIPKGATVIIAGYTDIVGLEAHNLKLSIARANDVKNIIESGLAKADRSDVTLKVNGFGEDESVSLFKNKFPEERFYNRTVIIDIIPQEMVIK